MSSGENLKIEYAGKEAQEISVVQIYRFNTHSISNEATDVNKSTFIEYFLETCWWPSLVFYTVHIYSMHEE